MVAGRPPKYDLDKEAEDLLKWSLLPDSTSIYQFTDTKEYLAQQLTEFCQQNEKFSLALKKAKERIGLRREHACTNETMNYGVWARSAHMYDKLLDDSEESKKDKDFARRKALEASKPAQVIVQVKNDGLASGTNIPTKKLSNTSNNSSK